jgi:hypothetical protein
VNSITLKSATYHYMSVNSAVMIATANQTKTANANSVMSVMAMVMGMVMRKPKIGWALARIGRRHHEW